MNGAISAHDDEVLVDDSIPNPVRAVIDVLDGLERGKMLTRTRLSELVGTTTSWLSHHTRHRSLVDYRENGVLNGNVTVFFGSKDTIADFRAWKTKRRGA